MTIRATYLALSYLFQHGLPREADPTHHRHIVRLLTAHMVKFQNYRVTLSAIHARMGFKIVEKLFIDHVHKLVAARSCLLNVIGNIL